MSYKTYAEAKIANPDCEIVTTGKNWIYDKELTGTFQPRVTEGCSHAINDYSWVICNPADYCSTLKEFLDAGFNFAIGDLFLGTDSTLHDIEAIYPQTNKLEDSDDKRYILSAAALNGGCKIPAKAEKWSIYNNTMPLSALADEQYGKMRRAHDAGNKVEVKQVDTLGWCVSDTPLWDIEVVYRIKPKSERELFIEAAINHGIKSQKQTPAQIFGELFDSGRFEYKDNTQHFGENI